VTKNSWEGMGRAVMVAALGAVALTIGGCTAPQQSEPPAEPASREVAVAKPKPEAAPSVSPPVPAQIQAHQGLAIESRGVLGYSGSAALARLAHPTFPGTERFPEQQPGGELSVADHPVSTFSVDVDTASYGFVRRNLSTGSLPPRAAVRVEEMVNYFPYDYLAPTDRARPFRVTTTLMPNPWNAGTQVLHVAIRGYDIARDARPRANVVLLIDTSGSMAPADRLPLLRQGLRLFAAQLRDDDRVAIVTYAGNAQIALEPTAGREKDRIVQVIDGLHASGSTAGGEGLQRAYALAQRGFDREAVNRVILATDGDFNVGITDPRELERFVAEKRKTGIYLSILGVGTGNLNDALMQRLAQAGNGNAAYIDSLLEARKVLREELASTLFPIADDVKVQVEFNPSQVEAYRLVGYETRMLRREDFRNDKVDAGDVGAGHSVTAIYELVPAGSAARKVDPLRYQREPATPPLAMRAEELAFVKLRYKLPGASASRLIEQPVRAGDALGSLAAAPAEQRFAIAVAAFGQRLRGESALEGFSYATIAELANAARGNDPEGYRAEFIRLVRMADTLALAAR
jgi:Ca-activated chloride channel family protein